MIETRADAGDPVAMFHLGNHYSYGLYGLEKDMTRAIELFERAAEIGGSSRGGRFCKTQLGVFEHNAGNYDIALQHYMIAAKMGHQGSLNKIKNMFVNGHASKADYAEALRGHHSAAEEMRSPDREEALALLERTN
ncbi:hypothetical protein THAOC_26026 [Thalassiosira oceanica]|uniref:Sel1 repeat family protein n=1 Tax=Thalassiosira oceanica TaxID=159749 RepID=K0RMJ5_THAOC|nr:hypothetical protein THAOC_26026 [Thalassiosira oceanica]|eukprot:EJK54355.1 hypothetical protein THAOC_26026 [Thalassiosira oceanica]